MPTTAAGIWFPDKNSNLRHEVNMATMAASIENGIGKRLTAQESVVGLKVVGGVLPIPTAMATTPYYVGATGGCFVKGITYEAGIATIQTRGLYFVAASLTMDPSSGGASVACNIVHNFDQLDYNENPRSPSNWASAKCAATVVCEVGDTIWSEGKIIGGGTTGNVQEASNLNIMLVSSMPAP